MNGNGKASSLIYAFAVGVPSMIGYHNYSAYLSSPWTTGKLMTDGDLAEFWRLFWEATASSFLFAGVVGAVLSYGTHSVWPLVVALVSEAVVTSWMYYDYSTAIERGSGGQSP